ncbi:MAG: hypothetical protein J1E36_01990 [Eubacterium sp.]|nr:hypothetical protein [Eubacterium sp.]
MKKLVISISVIIISCIVLLIGGVIVYDYVIPDYMKCDEVFKGYTDCDGYTFAGRNLREYYIYSYSEEHIELFAQSDLYTEVDDSNIAELRSMIKNFEEYSEQEIFSNTVSNGDYFILRYYDGNAKEVEKSEDKYMIYFFDTDSQKLHYTYRVG